MASRDWVPARQVAPEGAETEADLAPDDFDTWLSPPEALSLLISLGRRVAVAEILRRAENGLVRGAGTATWRSDTRDRKAERALIQKGWWTTAHAAHQMDDDFWKTGGITFQVNSGARTYSGKVPIHFFGVRFDVDAIRAILPAPAKLRPPPEQAARIEATGRSSPSDPGFSIAMGVKPTPTPTTQPQPEIAQTVQAGADPAEAKPPKVPLKELREWYLGQFAEKPSLPYHEVAALAGAHFRPRRVTRQPLKDVISELGHTLSQGNPTIRRK